MEVPKYTGWHVTCNLFTDHHWEELGWTEKGGIYSVLLIPHSKVLAIQDKSLDFFKIAVLGFGLRLNINSNNHLFSPWK